MKKNEVKGFTLIELLAVIVILAIIALIATPIVLSIISDSKESSGLRSAEMYLDAVEQAISLEKMNNTNFNPNSCNITNEGNLYCDEDESNIIEVEVNGETPINGSIAFEEGKITDISLVYNNDKVIVKNEDGNLVYGEAGSEEEGLAPGLYAADGTMTYSWEELLTTEIPYNSYYGGGEQEAYCTILKVNNGWLTVAYDDAGPGEQSDYLRGKLIIDSSVQRIGDCFQSCSYLTEIVIPNSVTKIDDSAFMSCSSLTTITYDGTISQFESLISGCDLGAFYPEITVHCTDGDTTIASNP